MKHFLALLLLVLLPILSHAVRPFITDDARVVGARLAQWESWLRFDRESGEHWHMLAYGPFNFLEATFGFVYGYEKPREEKAQFSFALPLLQAKFLFREYSPGDWPGVGLVAGTFLPGGKGALVPEGYGAFSYLTVSQCFGEGEKALIHANAGVNYLYTQRQNQWVGTWGLGTQIKAYKGFHLVGEIFSGDPYVPGTGLSYQLGFRHFFSDLIQIDATVGQGLAGENKLPLWCSAGIRLVTERFLHREKKQSTSLLLN